jgi:hypothetical protein
MKIVYYDETDPHGVRQFEQIEVGRHEKCWKLTDTLL